MELTLSVIEYIPLRGVVQEVPAPLAPRTLSA